MGRNRGRASRRRGLDPEGHRSHPSILGNNTLSRPKSLLVCSPSTKLLSLEEAQARTQAQLSSPATTPCLTHSDYIEVGEGPGALLGKFHTVIELPMERWVERKPWGDLFRDSTSFCVFVAAASGLPSKPRSPPSATGSRFSTWGSLNPCAGAG